MESLCTIMDAAKQAKPRGPYKKKKLFDPHVYASRAVIRFDVGRINREDARFGAVTGDLQPNLFLADHITGRMSGPTGEGSIRTFKSSIFVWFVDNPGHGVAVCLSQLPLTDNRIGESRLAEKDDQAITQDR